MFQNRPNLEVVHEDVDNTCATYDAHTVQREALKKFLQLQKFHSKLKLQLHQKF